MEGRVDNYNDIEEIRRMLRQLMEHIACIEARTLIGRSYDGEGCVNPYMNRVACINTLISGSLDGEYEGDSSFHCCTPLCESIEEGHDEDNCEICFEVEKTSEKVFGESKQVESNVILKALDLKEVGYAFLKQHNQDTFKGKIVENSVDLVNLMTTLWVERLIAELELF
ncbi:hypothetical protein L3X38_014330 [Prunus dulcis]|uniref:Uncharacterized protein n=1 Tax=Prunus dulcis TaxID=3755 RepID=A0AAD4WNL7_PRUDU|nr:hypothetical protein L3X38_014330 [Prunus dulcis]